MTNAGAVIPNKKKTITGIVLSTLGAMFMLFDAVLHLLVITPVVIAFNQLGYPLGVSRTLGVIELACAILYLIPRTSVLGAVLLTGYLGGAIATQVRVGAPLLSTGLFPIYIALFLWGGLYLRDARLRSVFPIRK
ncbi:MAG TPA: DoxX family protein [Gemmatimonadaceae bacterium]|jgi:hypothetical protein